MEKLTLENIAPFLPYDVSIVSGNNGKQRKVTFNNVDDFKHIHISSLLRGIGHKLILRPTNLTQSITVEGKEIIPIVDLAKMADLDFTNNEIEFKSIGGVSGCKYYDYNGIETVFNYSIDTNSFYLYNQDTKDCHQVFNQLALFKQLYAWKMDVDNLIGRGLAIDVNTLENNPY